MKALLSSSGVHKFSVVVQPSNCTYTISPTGKYKPGTVITVVVTPNYRFHSSTSPLATDSGVSLNYENVVTSNNITTYTFIMPSANVIMNANCVADPTYGVSLSASGGTVRASKTTGIYAGEVITLTMTPNTNYTYARLDVTGVALSSNNGSTATFTMPSNNVTVHAVFNPPWFTHTLTIGYRHVGNTGEEYGYHRSQIGGLSPDSYDKIIAKEYNNADGVKHYFVSLTSNRVEGYIAFANNRSNTFHFSYKDDLYDNKAAFNAFRSRNGQSMKVYLSTNRPSWY